jgi:hypothetical protein
MTIVFAVLGGAIATAIVARYLNAAGKRGRPGALCTRCRGTGWYQKRPGGSDWPCDHRPEQTS